MKRHPLTARVPDDLAEQVRRAAYWLRLNQNDLLVRAIQTEVERLQREGNEGRPFEAKPGEAERI